MVFGALAILILIWGTTWAAIRIGLEGLPPFSGIAIRFAIASVVLIVIGLLAGLPLGSSRRERLLWLVNAVTFLLYFWLLDRLPATRLSLITYGVPIVAVIVGSLFLGEPFTMRMFLGGVLVLVGVGLALQAAGPEPAGSH